MRLHKNVIVDTLKAVSPRRLPLLSSRRHTSQACMFLMGGGSLATSQVVADTIALAVQAARQRQKSTGPLQVLHIPTAKTTREKYDESIHLTAHIYTRYHGAQLSVLHEFGAPPDLATAKHLLAQADLIHMPGGSTEYALAFWREYGLIKPIMAAVNRGAVVFGQSAGQIIWFEQALTDSDHYALRDGEAWRYKMIPGIGEFRCAISPHAADYALRYTHDHACYQEGTQRRDVFVQTIIDSRRNGLAVDGNTAIMSLGGTATVLGAGEVTLYQWDRARKNLKTTSLHAGEKFHWSQLEDK